MAKEGHIPTTHELDWDWSSVGRRTRTLAKQCISYFDLSPQRSLAQRFPIPKRVLIMGKGKSAESIKSALSQRGQSEYEMIGYIDEPSSQMSRLCESQSALGTYEELTDVVNRYRVAIIVVCVNAQRGVLPYHSLLKLKSQGVEILEGPTFQEALERQLPLSHIHPSHLVFEGKASTPLVCSLMMRLVDVVGALSAIFLLAPIFAILVCLIKLHSDGSLFVRISHEGRYGYPFSLLQFRIPSEPRSSHPRRFFQTLCNRMGRVCSGWHLAKLPQLFHVLQGQMSLVGPRPVPVSSAHHANENLSYFRLRQSVRPGLTGWAQTHMPNTLTSFITQEELECDLYYIRQRSVGLDVLIVLKTIQRFFLDFSRHS